jgi:hypothetical protein
MRAIESLFKSKRIRKYLGNFTKRKDNKEYNVIILEVIG